MVLSEKSSNPSLDSQTKDRHPWLVVEPLSGAGPARIADVAARAGVGVATVSRVLNGHASVRPATRDRVQDAIRALNYRPSSVARNLSLQRTMVVGRRPPLVHQPVGRPARARDRRGVERLRLRPHGVRRRVRGSAAARVRAPRPRRPRGRPTRRIDAAAGVGGRAHSRGPDAVHPRRRRPSIAPVHRSRRRCRGRDGDAPPDRARPPAHRAHRRHAARVPLRLEPRPDARATSVRSRAPGIASRPEYLREGTRLLHVARGHRRPSCCRFPTGRPRSSRRPTRRRSARSRPRARSASACPRICR